MSGCGEALRSVCVVVRASEILDSPLDVSSIDNSVLLFYRLLSSVMHQQHSIPPCFSRGALDFSRKFASAARHGFGS
eukprot:scaffold3474_cov246-Pinguiococcus_pyrenoidosus.AAC.6